MAWPTHTPQTRELGQTQENICHLIYVVDWIIIKCPKAVAKVMEPGALDPMQVLWIVYRAPHITGPQPIISTLTTAEQCVSIWITMVGVTYSAP